MSKLELIGLGLIKSIPLPSSVEYRSVMDTTASTRNTIINCIIKLTILNISCVHSICKTVSFTSFPQGQKSNALIFMVENG